MHRKLDDTLGPARPELMDRKSYAPRHTWYVPAKVLGERLIAAAACVIAAPAIGIMALLAKITSPGPAFYSQVRMGRGGKLFHMYKIRTMRHNCEADTGPVWARVNDHRVTPIGRFLRYTHLDELPQLANIAMGQMSIVGPRPERPEIVAQLEAEIPAYHDRLILRPGLTGLAQVQLPADADLRGVRHKLAYDLYYVQNVSPWLDARIVACTALQMAGLCADAIGRTLVRACREAVEQELAAIDEATKSAGLARELMQIPASDVGVGFPPTARPVEQAAVPNNRLTIHFANPHEDDRRREPPMDDPDLNSAPAAHSGV